MSLETLPNPEFYPEWKDWANALLREIKSEPEPSLNSDSISAFDESAQDAVGLALTDTVTVNFTYDDALHQISAIVIDDSISNAKLANMVQATFKMRAAGAGTGDPIDGTAAQAKTALAIVAADLSDFAEAVQDTIGAAAADSATIDFTYDDGAGTLTADVKADSITYALLQNVSAPARFLGRITAGAGDTEELTGTQATTLLDPFTSALKGLAPASGGGTDNFLRADGTWDEPPGTGGAGASYEAGPSTPPTTADLATWVNQDTSTATDGTGALILLPQVNGEFHSLVKAAPATPYNVYCRVDMHGLSTAALTAAIDVIGGIALRDSSDGEMVFFGPSWSRLSGDEQNLYNIQMLRSAAGVSIASTLAAKYTGQLWKWVRIHNDGTTLTFYASTDGKNWVSYGTELLSNFIDAADEIGIFAYATANATEAVASFSYFSTTAPS